ncbi:hypothetical protein SAY86_002355 [Trapa natans]|uniref:PUM-HD domain-containing protein n=1 Tax=Trapa natans TaxID=22666 RepID=A0AAN7LFV3_TRANT|nr:hypothetical protein SAY86_002355 [Trapa natans]
MGENKREVAAHEVGELLGEIPMATSCNPCYEELQPKAVLLDSFKGGSHSMNFQINSSSPQRRFMASINAIRSSFTDAFTDTAQVNVSKLPDEQALTSAFAEVSIHDALGGQVSKSLSQHHLKADPQMRNLGFDAISGERIGQSNSDACWVDPLGLRHHQGGEIYRQADNSTGGISMSNNEVQSWPGLPVLPLDLPMVDQRQYMNSQPPLSCLHLPQMDQSQTTWRDKDQQSLYGLLQQKSYYQQFLNGYCEPQCYAPSDLKREQFFEIPSSQSIGQTGEDSLLHGHGLARFSKPLSLDAHAVHDLDRISEKQNFDKKNMMGSNGFSTTGRVNFGYINDTVNRMYQSGKLASSNQLYCLYALNDTECFQDDDLHCSRSYNSRLPLSKYNCTIGVNNNNNNTHHMAKDQHWCRFLQRMISEGGPKDVEKVFTEIIDHIMELVTDPFGNYLVQKLLEVCSEDQHTRIIKVITRNKGDLTRISCDVHGTRVVQKAIETLKTPEQISIMISALEPCIVILMKNMNGNHVAQRCFQHLTPEYSQFLFDSAANFCVELATDRHGCCVLQKCLSYSFGGQRMRIIHKITSNSLVLSQDPFGNYVVQFIFELDVPQARDEIFNQLEGNYADLSMQKYSSNVVEKCLEYAAGERCDRIIRELICNPRLDQIMQDPYGNYVIQAVLNFSKGDLKSAIVEAIEAHVPMLRTSPYGKKVLSCNSLRK